MPEILDELGWQRLATPLARAAEQERGSRTFALRGCLLTTYEAVDTPLLVEQLLPEWLGIARRFRADVGAQTSFVIELHEALAAITAERFVIVSSPAPATANPYPWLKSVVTFATVGATGGAVQHAKLWMLHWESRDDDGATEEFLEIAVSSANLTQDAFRNQIQLAWRALLPLERKPTKVNRSTWGILPAFIEHLADACGSTRGERIRWFGEELLGRAASPRGAEFVASASGNFEVNELKRTPWGLRGLQEAVVGHGRGNTLQEIVAPTIGVWSAAALNSWCDALGTPPSLLTLMWISRHCEKWKAGWTLPRETVKAMKAVNARICGFQCFESLPTPQLHKNHRDADPRWLHAKCYSFKRGKWEGSLITSANFTQSAWGKVRNGGLAIDNFELGVLVSETFPFQDNWERPEPLHVCDEPAASLLLKSWLAADWNGETLTIEFASNQGEWWPEKVIVRAFKADEWLQSTHAAQAWPLVIAWPAAESEPHEASVVLNDGTRLETPILDLRQPEIRRSAPLALPGVSEEQQQFWREQILLERHGATVLYEGESLGAAGEATGAAELADNAAIAADYSVPAFEQFRAWTHFLDSWKYSVEQAPARSFSRTMLLKDGEQLAAYFNQRAASHPDNGCKSAARLIAEELCRRLKLLSGEQD